MPPTNRKPALALATTIVFACVSPVRLDAAAPAPAAGVTRTNPPIRALIVTGQDYPGHVWRETTPVLRQQLLQDPRFLVVIVEDPHVLDSSALERYDVIILHFMNWESPAPGQKARNNLRQTVAAGKGLVFVHFACGAFQDWPEFRQLAGRVYDPKLRPHDPRGRFTVNPVAVDHPITRGLKPFEADDELYTCLAGDTPVELLATARSSVDNRDYPMAFVLTCGQGRIFHSPLGHDAKALGMPGVGELFRRGTAWAAGQPPVETPRQGL